MNPFLRWVTATLGLIGTIMLLTRVLPTEPGPPMNGWDWVAVVSGLLVYAVLIQLLPEKRR